MSLSRFGFNTPKLRLLVAAPVVNNLPADSSSDPDIVKSVQESSPSNTNAFTTFSDSSGRSIKRSRLSENLDGDLLVEGGISIGGNLNMLGHEIVNASQLDADVVQAGIVKTSSIDPESFGTPILIDTDTIITGDLEVSGTLTVGSYPPLTTVSTKVDEVEAALTTTTDDLTVITGIVQNIVEVQLYPAWFGAYRKLMDTPLSQGEQIIAFDTASSTSSGGFTYNDFNHFEYDRTATQRFLITLSFRLNNSSGDRVEAIAGIYVKNLTTPDMPSFEQSTLSDDIKDRESRSFSISAIVNLQQSAELWPIVDITGSGASDCSLSGVCFTATRIF